jgi:hypothetical protein
VHAAQFKAHTLPPFAADEQQRRSLGAATQVIQRCGCVRVLARTHGLVSQPQLRAGTAQRTPAHGHPTATAHNRTRRLRERGYAAYIVGGWVRDVYLGRTPADIDIATSATPHEVRALFAGAPLVTLPRSTVKLTHQGEVRAELMAGCGSCRMAFRCCRCCCCAHTRAVRQ